MNKVFVLAPGEDWIVDRFVKEWNHDNSDISVNNPASADVIWLLADWCWKQIDFSLLKEKKVITTVHHIVPHKFGEQEKNDFLLRDSITDLYHVYNLETMEFISRYTRKPIKLIYYWANQNIWFKTGQKSELRNKFSLPKYAYVIGSFQRDTEGSDLITPKLEKGPDLLVEFIKQKHAEFQNNKEKKEIHVLLSGWRRQYVINNLKDLKIDYTYIERPKHEIINELYQTLDMYPVTARYEGGPQSLIECGLLKVPTISRNVGIAKQVLPLSAINDNVIKAIPAIPNVENWKLPNGYKKYREAIQSM